MTAATETTADRERHCLIVEDEPVLADLLDDVMRDQGFLTTVFNTSEGVVPWVREMSDAQSGRQVEDFWFRASDGLPLRNTRSASIGSDSPVGAVTYAEEGEWRLTSLTPRT